MGFGIGGGGYTRWALLGGAIWGESGVENAIVLGYLRLCFSVHQLRLSLAAINGHSYFIGSKSQFEALPFQPLAPSSFSGRCHEIMYEFSVEIETSIVSKACHVKGFKKRMHQRRRRHLEVPHFCKPTSKGWVEVILRPSSLDHAMRLHCTNRVDGSSHTLTEGADDRLQIR